MATYSTGSDNSFEMVTFGIPSQHTLHYLQGTLRDPMQATTEVGKMLAEQSQRAYDFYSGHDAINEARAAMRAIENIFMPDDIREYQTISQMQQAQSQMRQYIMADPYIRGLYHQGRIEGYADYYFDTNPDDVGRTHDSYRKMVDGVVQIDEEGEHVVQFFMHGDSASDSLPHFTERIDMCNTVANIRTMIKQGFEDPTSPTNARLD